MPSFFLTNAGMLVGLAALSIPIVIHLLLRRKKKRLRFSTIQFFLRQDEHASQRRKIRNWLLLTLRLLICALLVLAFARPYLSSGGAAGARQKQRAVFVLDRSLSMQATGADRSSWAKAREAVRQRLAEMKSDDEAALIGCGPTAEILSGWAPPSVIRQLVSELEPTWSASQLNDGLRQAQRLLDLSEPDGASVVYVVSDLQRSGCQNLAQAPVAQNATVKTLFVGDLVTPNFAITDLQATSIDGAPARITVASFSDEPDGLQKVQLVADGKPLTEFQVALPPGASTNLEFALPLLSPGWHSIEARLQAADALTADDARFETVFIPPPARTLIAEPRRNKRVFEQETFFLSAALEPAKGASNSVLSRRFACEQIAPEELASRLAQQNNEDKSWVILPGLRQLPASLAAALIQNVEGGGGLLLFSGDDLNVTQYNAQLLALLPAALATPEHSASLETGWHIGRHETNHPMFRVFAQPNSGDLSLARFYTRSGLLVSDTNSVVARFDDGGPLVLVKRAGSGRVVFVNTSADTAWTDWPKHKTFVPWLHGLGQYLGQSDSAAGLEASIRTPTVGADLEIDLGRAFAKAQLNLIQPGGRATECLTDDNGVLRIPTLTQPGVYSIRNTQGAELRRTVVNVPPQEADLAAISAGEFEKQITRMPPRPSAALMAGLLGASSNRRELWRVLLMSVVGLLLVEMALANRMQG